MCTRIDHVYACGHTLYSRTDECKSKKASSDKRCKIVAEEVEKKTDCHNCIRQERGKRSRSSSNKRMEGDVEHGPGGGKRQESVVECGRVSWSHGPGLAFWWYGV